MKMTSKMTNKPCATAIFPACDENHRSFMKFLRNYVKINFFADFLVKMKNHNYFLFFLRDPPKIINIPWATGPFLARWRPRAKIVQEYEKSENHENITKNHFKFSRVTN